MKILVHIPAFNEERTIHHVVARIPRTIAGVTQVDVVVNDDGSQDATSAQARAAGARVISTGQHIGLGNIFQRGVTYALEHHYDALVNIDADGQFNPDDIPKLLAPLINHTADFVTASRFIDAEYSPSMSWLKKWGNHQVARLISFVCGRRLYDVSCGFRVYSREALLQLNLFSRFTYTHETILNLAFKGLRISEVAVRVRGEREFGESKIASPVWKYGYNIANTIFRTIIDYKPLRFFGWSSVILCIVAGLGGGFVLGHWLLTGEVTPYKAIGFISLFLVLFGLLLFIVGLLADMINKARVTQERMLYLQKKQLYEKK